MEGNQNLSLAQVYEILTERPAEPTDNKGGAAPPVSPEPTGAVEPAVTPASETENTGEETTADGDKEQNKPNRLQKRFDELTREKYEAQRERDYYKGLAEGRIKPDKPAAAAETKKDEVVIPGLPPKPVFDERYQGDYDQYVIDAAKWAIQVEGKMKEMHEAQNKAQAHSSTVVQEHQKRLYSFKATKPDFDEVVENAQFQLHKGVLAEIVESPQSPELIYYLATNPQEADRLNALPLNQQIKEIGKLEVKLAPSSDSQSTETKEEVPVKRVSQAPEPIAPVGGKGSNVKDESQMSDKEWLEHENNRVRKLGRLY